MGIWSWLFGGVKKKRRKKRAGKKRRSKDVNYEAEKWRHRIKEAQEVLRTEVLTPAERNEIRAEIKKYRRYVKESL